MLINRGSSLQKIPTTNPPRDQKKEHRDPLRESQENFWETKRSFERSRELLRETKRSFEDQEKFWERLRDQGIIWEHFWDVWEPYLVKTCLCLKCSYVYMLTCSKYFLVCSCEYCEVYFPLVDVYQNLMHNVLLSYS